MTAATVTLPSGFFERFLTEMHAPDWIQARLLLIAIFGLFWTASALREQTRARDFENYFSLMERISNAFRRFGDAEPEDRFFEFNELMNVMEAACHLYNAKNIRGSTREMIRDYLEEILPNIFADEQAQTMIAESFSGPDTFFQIRRFAHNEHIDGVPQQ